jgi:hypothetical protein
MKKTTKRNSRAGECLLCDETFPRAKMTAHLKSCLSRKTPDGEPTVRCFHLFVAGTYLPDYWMQIAIPADSKLKDLDGFLRRTWLECCGHLSSFTIDGVRYEIELPDDPMFGGIEVESMKVRLDKVLAPGTTFAHEYDYGSTTDLQLKVLGIIEISKFPGAARILARNLPPEFPCAGCGKPATKLANGGDGLDPDDCYCDACAAELDEDDQDMLMPIVNSPRVGVCGYTG